LGCYLEGQGHSMTLQQNHVRPITSLLKLDFTTISQNWSPNIETMCRAQHLGYFYTLNFVCDITLTLQEVYLPVSKTYSGSITRFNRLLLILEMHRGQVYFIKELTIQGPKMCQKYWSRNSRYYKQLGMMKNNSVKFHWHSPSGFGDEARTRLFYSKIDQ
jgi:hypothetical protein